MKLNLPLEIAMDYSKDLTPVPSTLRAHVLKEMGAFWREVLSMVVTGDGRAGETFCES